MDKHPFRPTPLVLATLLPLLPLALGAAGCGVPPDDEGDPAEESETAEAALTAAAVVPDPGTVFITSVDSIGGSGCPQGTANATLSADRQTMNVIFSKYAATMGPGIPLTKNRLNCTIILGVHVPQGFTFTVSKIDNRGFVNIPSGVTARVTSNFRMQGVPDEVDRKTEIRGPAKRDFTITNTFNASNLVWSGCGDETNAIVETSLLLSGSRTQQSTISIDRLSKNFAQLYRMTWKRCK
jgi:hypothetical protein